MLTKSILILLLVALNLTLKAQQTAEKLIHETRYLLYLPEGYGLDTAKRWPLLLFLHGSGECGTDIEKVKVNGPPKLIGEGKKYPFIVVSPQADEAFRWEPSELYRLLLSIKQKYLVDRQRVYLTGLSMGGYCTWRLGKEHPEEFAAMIPVCGDGDTADSWKLRHMPVWAFHGAKDPVVPLAGEQLLINSIKPYGADVRFTIYPETGHDAWVQAYQTDSLYTWMLSQKKYRYTEAVIDTHLLQRYVGRYLNANKDTFQFLVKQGKLNVISPDGQDLALIPAAKHQFFYLPDNPLEFDFNLTKSGKVKYAVVYGGHSRVVFTKQKPMRVK